MNQGKYNRGNGLENHRRTNRAGPAGKESVCEHPGVLLKNVEWFSTNCGFLKHQKRERLIVQ